MHISVNDSTSTPCAKYMIGRGMRRMCHFVSFKDTTGLGRITSFVMSVSF